MDNNYYLNGDLEPSRLVRNVLGTYILELDRLCDKAMSRDDINEAHSYMMRNMVAHEILDHLICDEDDLTDIDAIDKTKKLPPKDKIYISDIGEINMRNMCCPSKPVVVQEVRHHEGDIYYNCHCKCGLWCTQAFEDVSDAVRDYESMNRRRTAILKKVTPTPSERM